MPFKTITTMKTKTIEKFKRTETTRFYNDGKLHAILCVTHSKEGLFDQLTGKRDRYLK